MAAVLSELAPGTRFAGHVVGEVIGRGGMGVVYRARHVDLKREVALKVIAPASAGDPGFRVRFRRECTAAAAIEHPNVVPIYHAGEEDGRLYVTMRYVRGTDLAQRIEAAGSLPAEEAVSLVADVAGALDVAHRRGLVHRDVKPGNLLIEEREGAGRALLTDFGLTKDVSATTQLTEAGTVLGTVDYAAPEQLDGDAGVDARTDVYALGCVLYHALTGVVPYPRRTTPAKIFAHLSAPVPAATGVPEPLAAAVARAMAKDPATRYASAGAFARAIQAAVEHAAPVGARGTRAARTMPLAAALSAEHGPFVGRGDALARLERCYELARAGRRQFALVAGEPGIGKTRLASEFARRLDRDAATVLYGRSNVESLIPYEPFIAALQQYLRHRDPVDLPASLQDDLSELSRFVPALRSRVPPPAPLADDPRSERLRLFESVARVVGFAATERPLVVVLDDLHWADTSTLLLAGHMMSDAPPAAMLLLATYREADVRHPNEFSALLARFRGSFERIRLQGLDAAETRALVAARAVAGASETFVRALHDRSDGNPFFMTEILRDLPARADCAPLRALASMGVPETVSAQIRSRLHGIDGPTSRVLHAASVVGREFSLEVVQAVTEEPLDVVIAALERAANLGLVRESDDELDRFVFAHALVQETLYEMPSAARRARRHHRIGQVLEAQPARFGASAAEIANHFFASGRLDRDGKAIRHAVRAAEEAIEALGYEEAAGHYRRALARGPSPPLLLGYADALTRAGDPEAAEACRAAAAAARAVGDGVLLARVGLLAGGVGVSIVGVEPERIRLLEEALAALGPEHGGLRAQVLARLAIARLHVLEPPSTAELATRAVAEAGRAGDAGALLAALNARHVSLWHPDGLDERLRLADQMIALAQREGRGAAELQARNWRCVDLWEAAELEAFKAEAARHEQLADKLRLPAFRWYGPLWRASLALLEGQRDDAAVLAGEACDMATRAGDPNGEESRAMIFGVLEFQTGNVTDELLAANEALMRDESRGAERAAMYAITCCLLYAMRGRGEQAQALLDGFAADGFARAGRHSHTLYSLFSLTEAAALLGDAKAAAQLYRRLAPYPGRRVTAGRATVDLGSVDYALGRAAAACGDVRRAAEHYEHALDQDERLAARPALDRTRARYAELRPAD